MAHFIPNHIGVHFLLVLISIGILWKSADWFVEGAVGIAQKLQVPPMLVGIVLVSLATTAPELMASLLAALQGIPEMALGNAVGSVIVDASVALGLAALLAATPLVAQPEILRTSAILLVSVLVLSFLLALDGVMSRLDGLVLVSCFAGYAAFSYWRAKQGAQWASAAATSEEVKELEAALNQMATRRILLLFVAGSIGVLLGSECLLTGAKGIATYFGMPPVVLGLTVVAVGTSIPEVATVVASALKKQSSVGVGNVIGADILNICWVAGLSATANPLHVQRGTLFVMFPAALIIVLSMLAMIRYRYRLVRWNGAVLLMLYVCFVISIVVLVANGIIKPPMPH